MRYRALRAGKVVKGRKRKVDSDDVIAIAELLSDELPAVGSVKRLARRVRIMAAKPFLAEIENLKKEVRAQNQLMREDSKRTDRLMKLVEDQDAEIEDLKNKLQKAKKRMKIEPKR